LERLAGDSVDPLDSTKHAVDPSIRDTLSGPHGLGKLPKHPSFSSFPWMMHGAFESEEDYYKPNLKSL